MADRPKVILEKSRVVRRRYQRSNKRFQFTASQIARIEREEERERQAKKLREKEKKRIADKKKRAKAREERLRLGLPDPNAPKVPASQPLLFNFIKKVPVSKSECEEQNETETETANGSDTEVATDSEFDDEDLDKDEEALGCLMAALGDAETSTAESTPRPRNDDQRQDEDEFSDCSAFDDADVIEETEAPTVTATTSQNQVSASQDSFLDDTAVLLEDYVPEFDPGASFDEELAQLDAI
ncbi:hypothetical protein BJX61DRAFT_543480 [Aspergillus egyptiacus]|nr:hypothetical protein BJX61DRAFT_543480 [Aspergillus egyptiacus]